MELRIPLLRPANPLSLNRRPVRLFIDSDLSVTDQTGRPVETKRPASQELPAIRGAELTVQLRAN